MPTPSRAIHPLTLTIDEQKAAISPLHNGSDGIRSLQDEYNVIAQAQLRKVLDTLNIDASTYADYLIQTMPGGMDGFLRSWGIDQFIAASVGRSPRATPADLATDLSRRLDSIPPTVVMMWGLMRYAHEVAAEARGEDVTNTVTIEGPKATDPKAAENAFEDALERAYWEMDARRKGTGASQGRPQSDRDAFKWAVRSMRPAPVVPSVLISEDCDMDEVRYVLGRALTDYFANHVDDGKVTLDPFDSDEIDPIINTTIAALRAPAEDDAPLYLQRLRGDVWAMQRRQRRLDIFMNTDAYYSLAFAEQTLLTRQHHQQAALLHTLTQRLAVAEKAHADAKPTGGQ